MYAAAARAQFLPVPGADWGLGNFDTLMGGGNVSFHQNREHIVNKEGEKGGTY